VVPAEREEGAEGEGRGGRGRPLVVRHRHGLRRGRRPEAERISRARAGGA
jgi:hypothetical protein